MMNDIEWKDEYLLGVDNIDMQHKIFMQILRKLDRVIGEEKEKDLILRQIHELEKFAEFHFCSEENLMLEVNYPDIMTHKKVHEELLQELRNIVFFYENRLQNPDLLVHFLGEWFIHHTIDEDKKMAQFLLAGS